jgi:CDP-6-deoxy-D-xylo-4-hexulose-3-dehydrase
MGIVQLSRLPSFVEARKKNFATLYRELEVYEDYFTFPLATPGSDPCWFAFPLTISNNAPFKRKELLNWLTKNNIEVKLFFTGNILAHPAYKSIPCRLAEKLSNSDEIMKNSFFLGVYPGLDESRLEYVVEKMHEFIKKHL